MIYAHDISYICWNFWAGSCSWLPGDFVMTDFLYIPQKSVTNKSRQLKQLLFVTVVKK